MSKVNIYGFTDKDYNNYLKKTQRIYNSNLNDTEKNFAQAMCETDSIVTGVEGGEAILELIKNAGCNSAD